MNRRQKEVLKLSLEDEQNILKWIEEIYEKAAEDTSLKIAELSARTDLENIQSIVYQIQYQQMIQAQIQTTLTELQAKEYSGITEYLDNCYKQGYLGALYDIAGQGIPITVPINQEKVVYALYNDSKLSQGLYARLGEDIDKLQISIKREVSRGVIEGKSFGQIANSIAKDMNSPFKTAKFNAMRIVRTEGGRVQQEAQMDACYEAKNLGADILKQWDSTLDGNTRESHRVVDGEIRELDEEFSNGLQFPKDPDGSAEEVINCRCSLLRRARWGLDSEELGILKKRAEYFGLDKTDNFNDFEEKFLKIDSNDSYNVIKGNTPNSLNSFNNVGSMSNDDAVKGANPDYNQGHEYQINCQRCTQAYELRKRGYDVKAKPYPSTGNKIIWGNECFTDTNGNPVNFVYGKTEKDVKNTLSNSPDGSRFAIYVKWMGGRLTGSHVFVAEKINGVVNYFDPQSGNMDASGYFSRGTHNGFGILRMDDKLITTDSNIIDAVVERG